MLQGKKKVKARQAWSQKVLNYLVRNPDLHRFSGTRLGRDRSILSFDVDYDELTWAFRVNCDKMGLQLTDFFRQKLIETYEMLLVRHGFMLVGDPHLTRAARKIKI